MAEIVTSNKAPLRTIPNPPSTIRIRQLTKDDADDYRKIRLSALQKAPETFGSTYEHQCQSPLSYFADRLVSDAFFGAYDNADIIGVVFLRTGGTGKDAHKGYVGGFFVEPSCRRWGIGSALMREIVKAARRVEGIEQLTLSVVKENVEALKLYEKCGFRVFGIEPRALKWAGRYWDEVHMILFLDEVKDF